MTEADKLITLEAWIEAHYGAGSQPSLRTVRTWNDNGNLVPAARKQGRSYYIPANARYIAANEPMPQQTILDRIRGAEAEKTH